MRPTDIRRVSVSVLLAALLAGCTAATPGTSVAPASVEASPTATQTAATESQEPSPAPSVADATAAAGLALTREVSSVTQVFVIEADGSARQVTGHGELASFAAVRPFWSPDREIIAFRPRAIGAGVDPQLWLVNADGSDQRPIADLGESIGWSPDSSRLLFEDSVYTTDTTGEPARIWLTNVASGESRVLRRGNVPQWRPDGEAYGFSPVRFGPQGPTFPIMVAPLDGGEPTILAEALNYWWSPDGTALLLEQEDGLHLAEADGSDSRFLVEGGTPAWSPDGTRLVYAYDHTSDALPIIGLVDRDGTVLWDGAVGTDPVWSPDGTKIAVEAGYPDSFIAILDAASGEVIWELEGQGPAW